MCLIINSGSAKSHDLQVSLVTEGCLCVTVRLHCSLTMGYSELAGPAAYLTMCRLPYRQPYSTQTITLYSTIVPPPTALSVCAGYHRKLLLLICRKIPMFQQLRELKLTNSHTNIPIRCPNKCVSFSNGAIQLGGHSEVNQTEHKQMLTGQSQLNSSSFTQFDVCIVRQ